MGEVRLNLAQRIALVVAVGVALLALGKWIVLASTPSLTIGWTGYAPLTRSVSRSGVTPIEELLLWVGLALIWAAASILILRSTVAGSSGDPPDVPPGPREARMNLARRVVVVVAAGLILLALGTWITTPTLPTPRRVASYRPWPHYLYVLRPTSLEALLMWIGLAGAWAVTSLALLRSARPQRSGDRATSS